MSNQSPNTRMSKKSFISISLEVRQIWGKIPNDMKVVILRSRTGNINEGVNKHSKDIYKKVKPSSCPPIKFTSAHLYQLLTKISSGTYLSEKNEVDTPKDEPN